MKILPRLNGKLLLGKVGDLWTKPTMLLELEVMYSCFLHYFFSFANTNSTHPKPTTLLELEVMFMYSCFLHYFFVC